MNRTIHEKCKKITTVKTYFDNKGVRKHLLDVELIRDYYRTKKNENETKNDCKMPSILRLEVSIISRNVPKILDSLLNSDDWDLTNGYGYKK